MQGLVDSNLSTGESAIYDRQIRLWGSNAQLRIKSSKVLFIGLSSATVEIAKNTVLAGASVVVEDTRRIDESTTNFLIQLEVNDTSNLTVAEATAFALHRLNEHPVVEFRKPDFSKHQQDSSVTAVVVSLSYLHYDIPEALAISKQARSMGIAFFAVIDTVNVSWMFSDFGASHIVDAHTPPLKRDERTGERAALTNKIEEFEFCDFSTYVTSPVNEKYWISKPSFPSDVFLFVHFYLKFRSVQRPMDKDPSPKRTRRDDRNFAAFIEEQLAEASKLSPRVSKFLGKRTAAQFAAHLIQVYETQLTVPSSPHMAAIHGALVTQELIKFVTKKDPPLVNSLVIHNEECSAIVVKQPASLSSKIISSGHEDKDEDDIEIVTGGKDVVLD